MTKKIAFVTGYTGQDGTFLTEYLLGLNYEVIGLCRRISTEPPRRVRGRFDFHQAIKTGQLKLVSGDLCDTHSLLRIFKEHPGISEVYNLAAQSDVRVSFDQPEQTFQQNAIGVLNLITVMGLMAPEAKLYQASTSEMFGTNGGHQNEQTAFQPASPYGEAKLAAYWMVRNWRNRGHFAANGILFNHESEIRGGDFVTQKIVREVCHRELHPGVELQLGNLEARRDWGYAGDYVKAMHAMLQVEKPDDYVIATGETHSVREFVEMALEMVGRRITWTGEGLHEVGSVDGKVFVTINRDYYRPVEVDHLHGDATKARTLLNWSPTTTFPELVALMVKNQISLIAIGKE